MHTAFTAAPPTVAPGRRDQLLRAGRTPALEPLTDTLLRGLPGPRAAWILAWALVPWLNAGANLLLEAGRTSAVWDASPEAVLLNYLVLSLAVPVALWGASRIARRLAQLGVEAGEPGVLRHVASRKGPLLAAAATAVAFAVGAYVREGWLPALVRGGTWLVLGTALWTYVWTSASVQLGLPRLARERLEDEDGQLDPGLRLRPLGALSFTALWMLLVWLGPVVLTSLADTVGVVIGLGALAGGFGAFVYAIARLHGQIAAVKSRELALARALYAEAYEPVRRERTLGALDRQRSLLGAAEALEKRAHAMHDWPIDEGTWARVLTIATSVVAMAVARLILNPLGL